MKRIAILSLFVFSVLVPVSASAQDILRQRLDTYANKVEGLFTKDQYGHMIKSIQDERDLQLSLLRDHQRGVENTLFRLEQLERDLADLVPDYAPVDHRANHGRGDAAGSGKITACDLNEDGTIGHCKSIE
jgi:hypothetical protein